MDIKNYLTISILCCVLAGCNTSHKNTHDVQNTDMTLMPRQIYCEGGDFHVQGVAVDIKRKYAYFSFTTSLIKTDLAGNIIGSVEGLTGHLGCIDINPADGCVYGSLEYKNDEVGKGILNHLDIKKENSTNAFYIAVFDVDKITRKGMNAETDSVLKTVYIKEVVNDYNATVTNQGKEVKHRYGCAGIDGTAFGPAFGTKNGKYLLTVACGLYGDTTRTDNDYQIILQYDVSDWKKYERPLSEKNIHQSGPEKPLNKYFVFTGNTTFGVQNLAYDRNTNYWFVAVYRGRKSQYPNHSMFSIDGMKKPEREQLKGSDKPKEANVLQLAKAGIYDAKSGIYSWECKWGSTGIHAIGNGYFYISQNGTTPEKKQYCRLQLYHWTGKAPNPFEEVK